MESQKTGAKAKDVEKPEDESAPVQRIVIQPLPCLCGSAPCVEPEDPEHSGNAWAEVRCENEQCPAKPVVDDGKSVADDRGSDGYKECAIVRWNKWISGQWLAG